MLPAGAARSGFVCEAETVQEPRKRAQLCLRQLTWRQEPRGGGGPGLRVGPVQTGPVLDVAPPWGNCHSHSLSLRLLKQLGPV